MCICKIDAAIYFSTNKHAVMSTFLTQIYILLVADKNIYAIVRLFLDENVWSLPYQLDKFYYHLCSTTELFSKRD